ncbi:hypothetical protein EGM15_19000, partial [Clostridioides difficile]
MGDFMNLTSWNQNRKLKKRFKGNKKNIKKYHEYYIKIYNHYNEIETVDSIRKIEIEQTRIRGQLEKNNNPGNALYIALIAIVFSLLYNLSSNIVESYLSNLVFNILKIKCPNLDLLIQLICIIIFLAYVQSTSLSIAKPYRDDIQFYTTALDVLEDMKKKILRERKYKKRR